MSSVFNLWQQKCAAMQVSVWRICAPEDKSLDINQFEEQASCELQTKSSTASRVQFSAILNKAFCRGTKQCNRVRCTSRRRHFQWWQLPAMHCNYVPLPPCDASEVHCSAFIELQHWWWWPPKHGLYGTLASSMHPSWVGDGNHQPCTSSCPDQLPFHIFNFKTKLFTFLCKGWTWLDMLCHLGSQWR